MKFEVPQRQQLQGIHRLLNVPPCSNRQTGQRVSVREIRYRKRPPMVRKGHSVRKTASCGTRRIFRSTLCAKTGFYGTGQIFGAKNSLLWYATHLQRRAEQHLLHRMPFQRPAEQPTPQTVDSLLGYATRFQGPRCMKTPSCCNGHIFSARNGLREEAGKHKKRVLIKVYQDFLDPSSARTVAAACRILRRRCLFQKNVKKMETYK